MMLAVAALLAVGCVQKSPEQVVTETRTEYFLEPTGMLVQELKTEPEAGAAEGEEVAGEPEEAEPGETAEGEEGMVADEGPRPVNVLFDVVVRFDGLRDSLPGITVEIAHSDPFDQEKGRYIQWIETAGMRKGDARQISFEREIPNYETGDEFRIEFREFVPPEERGDYREYEGAGA